MLFLSTTASKSKVNMFTIVLLTVMVIVSSALSAQTLKVTPYGFIKFDTAIDQSRTNNGNFAMWVDDADSDAKINMTARQTRLGANLSFDGLSGNSVTGRFEIDFYGAGGAENKNIPMLRHAYLKVDFGSYYLLAGQTSDIISPLVPTTVNYTVLWNSGNIGYRHPQIQIGNVVKSGVEIVGALSRNIAGDADGLDGDDGEDSAIPTLQGRVSYKTAKMNVGVSGHYGVMEYTNKMLKDDNYNSVSLNLHGSYTVTDAVSLSGEFFTGSTLDQYFGGIGQVFDAALEEEVESTGGWFNAKYIASSATSYNVGLGVDNPKKDDALNFPTRNSNMSVYGNVFTKIAHNTTLALEVSNWSTGYYDNAGDEETRSNLRVQASLILSL